MSDETDNRDSERRQMLRGFHVRVQQLTVKLGLPVVVSFSLIAVALRPSWQTVVFFCCSIVVGGIWILSRQIAEHGRIGRSVLLLGLSVVVMSGLLMNLFEGTGFAGAAMMTLCVIYASFYSPTYLWSTAGLATVGFLVSAAVEALSPWRKLEVHGFVCLGFTGLFSVFVMALIVFVLLKQRKLEALDTHRMVRMNEEQCQVIGTAGSLSSVLEESLRRIQEIAGLFAAQADEQAAAIAQIHSTMDKVKDSWAHTVSLAEQTQMLTTEVKGKSLSTIQRLREVEQGFEKIVEANSVAQAVFDDLAAQAERIEDILRTNREIAAQIKILAVNAGIQAAKAGEYGMGFRVVAFELKSMIQRTEESLSSSRKLLEDIRTRARQSADTVQHNASLLQRHFDALESTGQVIEEIASSVVETTGRIETMNSAAAQQQSRLDEVAVGIDHIDTAASDLTGSTQELLGQVERIFDSHQEMRIVLASSSVRR